jgi:hypothetical protein
MPGVFDPLPPAPPLAPPTTFPEEPLTAAEDLYRRMGPLLEADPANGYALLVLIEGIADSAQPVFDITQETDTHRPLETTLDPAVAPLEWLPWLEQVAGVNAPASDTEAQWRDRIAQAAGIYPGTDNAIRAEVARHLTSMDPAMVRVIHPAFWQITVAVRTSDTPDPAAAERAALCQTPAGFALTFVVSDEPIIDEGTETIDNVPVAIDAPPTIADVTV